MTDRRSFLIGALGTTLVAALKAQDPTVTDVDVQLVPNARRLRLETLNFGLPLPPGLLLDPLMARVIGPDGQEIEAAVRPLETWRDGVVRQSIRSLQVQCAVNFSTARALRIKVRLGEPRRRDRTSFEPVEKTLVKPDGLLGPRVLSVLPAEWLCASRVAGPQTPASRSGRYALYDQTVERNFAASLDYIASTDPVAWLFDRTSAWYKTYVRTGQSKYLAAAYRAANFVRAQTVATGVRAGTFRLRGADLKYVYPRALHLHYLLSGDPRALDTGKLMSRYCLDHWNPHYRPDQKSGPDDASGEGGHWTPRHQGFGLLGVLHGWEMSGDPVYLDKCKDYVDACYEHQNQPPDGRPADGSWRQNWATYDPSEATFEGGTSAWMTAILCDALFNHWTINKDPRIPRMILAWCDFLDARGLRPDAAEAFYVINCFAQRDEPGGVIGESMDLHNAELCHTFALGTFFASDGAKKAVYGRRVDRLLEQWSKTDLNDTPRAYNWALQASGQMIYLLSHTPDDV